MIENEKITDIYEKLGVSVFSKTDFEKLMEDSSFVENIGGVTSISLDYLHSGIVTATPRIRAYTALDEDFPHVNIHANINVLAEVGQHEEFYKMDIASLIHNNREYAIHWTIYDVLGKFVNIESIDPEKLEMDLLGFLFDMSRIFQNNDLHTTADVFQLSFYKYDPDIYDDVQHLFGGEANFMAALKMMKARKGVQVLYDKSKLISLLQGTVYEHLKVDDGLALQVHSDIPASNFLGIVPLGEYEESLLLK